MKINRRYKDRLFRMIFSEKKDMLELYHALSGLTCESPEDLKVVTLDDVIYMGMKNDLAFIIDDALYLWEHQSSWNPNMPLRGLLYVSGEYRKYIEEGHYNIYGTARIPLPSPQYVVFYNGQKEQPDRMEINLSEAFSRICPDVGACLEFKAVVLNINHGKNQELMERCTRLREYAEFVARVREYMKEGGPMEQVLDRAVVSCIRDGILAEFLSEHRAEVCQVIMTEYNEQEHIALERAEARREGQERYNQLILKLSQERQLGLIVKAASDPEFLEELYRKYEL